VEAGGLTFVLSMEESTVRLISRAEWQLRAVAGEAAILGVEEMVGEIQGETDVSEEREEAKQREGLETVAIVSSLVLCGRVAAAVLDMVEEEEDTMEGVLPTVQGVGDRAGQTHLLFRTYKAILDASETES